MIKNFLWDHLDGIDLQYMWFQQDGTTPSTANETLNILKKRFTDWIISQRENINWPSRSYQLTALDLFLLKETLYAESSNDSETSVLHYITLPLLSKKYRRNYVKQFSIILPKVLYPLKYPEGVTCSIFFPLLSFLVVVYHKIKMSLQVISVFYSKIKNQHQI